MRKMVKELEIYGHTQEAYDCVKERIATGVKRTCYIAATGVGKFYMVLSMMRDNPDKQILFVTSLAENARESETIAKEYFEDTSDIIFEIYQNLHK